MKAYHLRSKEELFETIRVLQLQKMALERDCAEAVRDIEADMAVVSAELALLKSLGEY